MKKYLKYLKVDLIFILYALILSLVFSLLYYFTNISSNTVNTWLFIMAILFFGIMGIKLGRKSSEKGYKVGLKMGFSLVLLMFFLSLLFHDFFSIQKIIYYGVLILVSMIGSVIGINFRK